MILKYGRTLSENMAEGAIIRDATITIPSFFTQEQRLMMLDAAEFAGLHVLQLVHENVAAAVMFGVDRLDLEKPVNILFYNMGGIDTEVTIARFSAVTDEKGKSYEHIEICEDLNKCCALVYEIKRDDIVVKYKEGTYEYIQIIWYIY